MSARSSLLFCSDWAPVRALQDSIVERPGSLYPEGIKALIQGVDMALVNVETVLHHQPGKLQPIPKEGPNLIGPAKAVQDLKAAGFTGAFLANNHTYDFGAAGLTSTREVLEEAGLVTFGSDPDPTHAWDGRVMDLPGGKVAILNFQEGEEGEDVDRAPGIAGWDLDAVRSSIRRHAMKGIPVIVVPHADREYLPFPAPYIQKAYRSLIDAGAAAVVAHHPHVPRGIELHKGKPIFYSQGNFLFNHTHDGLFRKLGYMVQLKIAPDASVAWEIHPYIIKTSGLELLQGQDAKRFEDSMARVSHQKLNPATVQQAWVAAMDAIPATEWLKDATGMTYTFEKMRLQDPVGLARLRTRLSAPAHREFMIPGISRVLSGRHGDSPHELRRLVHLWTDAMDWE